MAALMPYCHHPLQRAMKRGMLKWMPGMITCEVFEQFVVDYLDNALSDAQLKVFERHLKICAECNDYLRDYNKTLELAARSIEVTVSEEISNPPEDLIKAILDARRQDPWEQG